MKVTLPLDETKNAVCVSFARAPYLMYVDMESGERVVEVNGAAEAHGGAGIKAAQDIISNKADAVITVRCGDNAATAFQAAGIEIYKAEGLDLEENINLFKEEKLEKLTHFHAGFHGNH